MLPYVCICGHHKYKHLYDNNGVQLYLECIACDCNGYWENTYD